MKPTENELIDQELIPKIEKLFSDLYGGDTRPDLHENLLEVVNNNDLVYSLNFDDLDTYRWNAGDKGRYAEADYWANLVHDIRTVVQYFLADYPYITIENTYV